MLLFGLTLAIIAVLSQQALSAGIVDIDTGSHEYLNEIRPLLESAITKQMLSDYHVVILSESNAKAQLVNGYIYMMDVSVGTTGCLEADYAADQRESCLVGVVANDKCSISAYVHCKEVKTLEMKCGL